MIMVPQGSGLRDLVSPRHEGSSRCPPPQGGLEILRLKLAVARATEESVPLVGCKVQDRTVRDFGISDADSANQADRPG
jgi:hypothetical protein